MMDFKLLHYYTTSTCLTLCTEPTLRDFWRIIVPRISFETPFLLHGLLSLAALHIARYDAQRSDTFITQAMLHHNSSLAILSPLMTNIDAENCESLFLASTITVYFALGQPKGLNDYLLVRGQEIPLWLSLFRGTRLLLNTQYEVLKESAILPLLQHGQHAHNLWQASRYEEKVLDDLEANINMSMSEDPVKLETLNETIDKLRRSLAIAYSTGNTGEVGFRGATIWLVLVSNEFLVLVKEQQNEALCILAFFAVVLKRTEHAWWSEGWGLHLIQAVYSLLDESYKLWIRWPIEEIGWVPSF